MHVCCISRENKLHIIDFRCRDKTIITVCGDMIKNIELNTKSLQLFAMDSESSVICKKCSEIFRTDSVNNVYKGSSKQMSSLKRQVNNVYKQFNSIKYQYGYYFLRENYRKIRLAKLFINKLERY